jgi:ubiquinol-cytochrome c reductase cytochrome b subunit
MNSLSKKAIYAELLEWLDSRIGFTETMLKPIPEWSLNPFSWLGGLTVMVFLVQGLAGIFMLLYYVPLPDQAYSSTIYVIKSVPLGQLIETLHLYGAYAMILLAFMHLMRNYFSGAHKKPRELMWVAGMLLGFLVLGFSLTGYLLPWTIVSKSGTDVSIGMLGLLPADLGRVVKFLAVGSGSDAAMLRSFISIHTVVLPAAFLSLLGIKFYMFEIHGSNVPPYVKNRLYNRAWFPDVSLYAAMIGGVLIMLLLSVSALFPISLPPEFTPEAASSYVAQPDWYFLWMYQVLKFSFFEGPGIFVGLGVVTIFFLLLTLLPFYDRGKDRDPRSRPIFIIVGVLIVAELAALTIWGYFTPGQVIPGFQAAAVVGGLAAAVFLLSWMLFHARARTRLRPPEVGAFARMLLAPFACMRLTGIFVFLLTVASIAFASLGRCFCGQCTRQAALVSRAIVVFSIGGMTLIKRTLVSAYEGSGRF